MLLDERGYITAIKKLAEDVDADALEIMQFLIPPRLQELTVLTMDRHVAEEALLVSDVLRHEQIMTSSNKQIRTQYTR